MDLNALIQSEQASLTARLVALLSGDRATAEDLAQETFTRAWLRLPAGLDHGRSRAWMRKTATNLAFDELRRRTRRPAVAFDDLDAVAAIADGAYEPDAAREALQRLSAHERFVLLMHFEGGLTHAEIAQLLDVGEEAARKRVARARKAFIEVYRATRADTTPKILLVLHDREPYQPYIKWLRRAGADVRISERPVGERELAMVDGVTLLGNYNDLDSRLYGEEPRELRGEICPERDRAELAMLKSALALDLPIVGVCSGHQLLNIASGGTLFQDVVADGLTRSEHSDDTHSVRTGRDGHARHVLGKTTHVHSQHHQAVRRLGRNLRVTATSPDGVIETIERTDKDFAIGLQWHAELTTSSAGQLIAEALVDAAHRRAA